MPDFKKEWMVKADVDYFPQFMTLWLAFNSWYRSHYSEIDKNDRAFVEKLKNDLSGRNQAYKKFSELIAEGKIKENLNFKSNLEALWYSLNRTVIKYPDGFCAQVKISFNSALLDFSKREDRSSYIDLVKRPKQKNKMKLDEIFITDEKEKVFSCLMEIIYQLRCHLFHGNLDPSDENHEVIKYCYFVLMALMKA